MKITIDLPVDRDWIQEIEDPEEKKFFSEMSDAQHLIDDLQSDYKEFAFYVTELIEQQLIQEAN